MYAVYVMRMKPVLSIVFLFILSWVNAQQLENISWEGPIGTWRDHLPFNDAIAVTEGAEKIYCATSSAVFSLDKSDFSVQRLSTVVGLSDIGVGAIRYNTAYNTLVIGYHNGNLDLIVNNDIINIAAIKNSSILGDKKIYNITFSGKLAYLSCGFGIVVLNVEAQEIKETYLIGPLSGQVQVNDVAVFKGNIYAATASGLFVASLASDNLADYSNWSVISSIPVTNYNTLESFGNMLLVNRQVAAYDADTLYKYESGAWTQVSSLYSLSNNDINVVGDKLYLAHNGSVQILDGNLNETENIFRYNGQLTPRPSQAILGSDNWIWVADKLYGLVRVFNSWKCEFYTPNGPATNQVFDMDIQGTSIAVASGGYTSSFNNKFSLNGAYQFHDNNWVSHYGENNPALDTIFDLVCVAVDPNNEKHFFCGTWGLGLLEFKNDELKEHYYIGNSSLKERKGVVKWIGIGGLKFDNDGNLWMSNTYDYRGLAVFTKGGEWKNFDIAPYADENTEITDIEIDDFGRIWVVLPKKNEIIVYDHNGTIMDESDDQIKLLTSASGNGYLRGEQIYSLTKDQDGEMWIGSDEGVAVIYAPGNIFEGGSYDAQQILIEQDGTAQILLETETVTSIAIDGANRKWFGTEKSGAYLMTEDGLREVFHFSTSNSPLYSNTITDIVVNDENGETFYGTDKGILSYKSTATSPQSDYSNVVVYPNPVHPGYTGLIAIKGLMGDSDVKITDIAGNVIYETVSLGGQAIWDGKDFAGRRASSGIYFVMSVDPSGELNHVAKIMFVN